MFRFKDLRELFQRRLITARFKEEEEEEEKELQRQRAVLRVIMSPEIKLHRAGQFVLL